MDDDSLDELLRSEGYLDITKIDGKHYGIYPFLFTWGVVCDLTTWGNSGGRICFEDLCSARGFLSNWDGKTPPTVGKDGCTADKRRAP